MVGRRSSGNFKIISQYGFPYGVNKFPVVVVGGGGGHNVGIYLVEEVTCGREHMKLIQHNIKSEIFNIYVCYFFKL